MQVCERSAHKGPKHVQSGLRRSAWIHAVCTESKFVNRHKFLRLSNRNLSVHPVLLSSARLSQIADVGLVGDCEKASVVVLNVGWFGKDPQTGSSTIMRIFLKKSLFACNK